MNKVAQHAMTAAVIALVLVAALAVSMVGAQYAQAAPAAQEIPAVVPSARDVPSFATLFAGRVSTTTAATTYGQAYDVTPYETTETQLVVDMGTILAGAPNTLTVGYQYSNDRVNWTDLALTSGITNDQVLWSSQVITGHYLRAKLTPSSAGTLVTVTLSSVLEP